VNGRHGRPRGRGRDQGRVILQHADSELDAELLAGAYRTALRDLLIADRSRVDTTPRSDGGYLVSVTYVPRP
jgi:hypothetical protein